MLFKFNFYVAIDVYARAGIYRAFRYKIFLNECVMACFIDLSRNVIDFLIQIKSPQIRGLLKDLLD